MTDNALRAAAMQSKAWPYEEARKLIKRWPDGKPVTMVNLRCVDGLDLDALKINNYDGASH